MERSHVRRNNGPRPEGNCHSSKTSEKEKRKTKTKNKNSRYKLAYLHRSGGELH
jgi:hypothetical protein